MEVWRKIWHKPGESFNQQYFPLFISLKAPINLKPSRGKILPHSLTEGANDCAVSGSRQITAPSSDSGGSRNQRKHARISSSRQAREVTWGQQLPSQRRRFADLIPIKIEAACRGHLLLSAGIQFQKDSWSLLEVCKSDIYSQKCWFGVFCAPLPP